MGNHGLVRLVVLLLLCGAGCQPAGEALARRGAGEPKAMPDFYQADRAYGELPRHGSAYCGPTAAANALVWLDRNGYGNLLPAAEPGPKEQFALIHTLGTPAYMGTDPVKGTGPRGVMRGVARHCAERGYRARLEYAGWRTRHCRVAERPGPDWLVRQATGRSCLLLNIGWYKSADDAKTHQRLGGHFITVVGCERRAGATLLTIHDPAKRNHPRQRNSTSRCPVTCRLEPLAVGSILKTQKGATVPGEGQFALDGIRLKKGADVAIIDGAIGFSLSAQ